MGDQFASVAGGRPAQVRSSEEVEWQYLRQHLDPPRVPIIPLIAHISIRGLKALGKSLTAWMALRGSPSDAPPPRLATLARLALGPRQVLTMVEADGARFLVAMSADASPTFISLPAGRNSPWGDHTLPSLSSRPSPPAHATQTGSVRSQETAQARKRQTQELSNWDGSLTQKTMVEEWVAPSTLPHNADSVPGFSRSSGAQGSAVVAHPADLSTAARNFRHRDRTMRRSSASGRVSW